MFFFFKQKTAYEMRISDWSSDVCSSDLFLAHLAELAIAASEIEDGGEVKRLVDAQRGFISQHMLVWVPRWADDVVRHARTDLYRGVGWLARGVILEAASFFEIGAAKAKDRESGRASRRDRVCQYG